MKNNENAEQENNAPIDPIAELLKSIPIKYHNHSSITQKATIHVETKEFIHNLLRDNAKSYGVDVNTLVNFYLVRGIILEIETKFQAEEDKNNNKQSLQ